MSDRVIQSELVRRRLAWPVASVTSLLCLLGAAWALTQAYPPLVLWSLARVSGWLSLLTLSLALCVTPLARLFSRFTTMTGGAAGWANSAPRLRRLIGMTSAWLALAHGAVSFIPLHDPARPSLGWLLDTAHVRAGLSALLVLVTLLLTSFSVVIRALHVRAWKELHRLAYVAWLCAAQHVLLSPFAPRAWVLTLIAVTLAVGLLRLLPSKSATR